MKTLFVLASVMIVLFLAIPNKVEAQKGKATTKANESVAVAQPGFYIMLSRCNACALTPRQQRDAVMAFRGRGISAFYGSPEYDESYNNIEFLEKLPGHYGDSLFVGPFQTQAAAQRVVSGVPLILRKQIAEDQKDNLRQARAGFARRLSPGETTGFYEVTVVRVLSARVTGSFASLPPEDFLIRPGIGVGRILLGNSRSNILAVLGKPRGTDEEEDVWASGYEALTVRYRNGTVYQIEVSSPKFHTANGLTMAVSNQVFLKAFPTIVKYCCESVGASRSWEWTCWDAVTNGIAMRKGTNDALIVHRVNEAVDEDGDCKPCR